METDTHQNEDAEAVERRLKKLALRAKFDAQYPFLLACHYLTICAKRTIYILHVFYFSYLVLCFCFSLHIDKLLLCSTLTSLYKQYIGVRG